MKQADLNTTRTTVASHLRTRSHAIGTSQTRHRQRRT